MKKRLTVLALAFAMVLTMSASVFAAGQNANKADASARGKDASATEANLVKYLQMPEGLNDPDETFTFTFTPKAPNASNYGVPANEFTATSTTIKSADMTAVTTGNAADTGNKVGTVTIAKIFYGADGVKGGTGANADYAFPHAGEYTFTVAETAGSNTDITYASDTYTLRLVVDKDGNIDDVTVQKGEDGDKVDPTDVDPTNNGDDVSPADSKGGFTFTNLYKKNVTTHDEPDNKNPDPDPQDPDNPTPIDETDPHMTKDVGGAFVLDKKVLGEYGNQKKDFVFTVTVTLPKFDKDFVFTGNNAPTVTDNKGSISGTWADGQSVTVNLKHDGQLKFPKLPVGTKITVSEAAVDGYAQVWTTSQDGEASGSNAAPENVTENILVTEDAGGYAICRNSFHDESVTPTGIIINNLPYVLLIAIALGGIVLFSRKRRYE